MLPSDCGNVFSLHGHVHVNQTHFHKKKFRARTGFETETKANSEMVNSGLSEFRFIFIVQRFSLLDKNQDGHLTEDDVMSVPVDVVDEAFGQTPPGEVSEFRTR